MEAFLQSSAGFTVRRNWGTVRRKLRHDADSDVSDEVKDIVKSARGGFYFYLISNLASRGTSVNRQLFFISMVMNHKGLSRSGLHILSLMNQGLSPRSFDAELVIFEQSQAEKLRSVLLPQSININDMDIVFSKLQRECISVMWIDNFSKSYAVAMQSVTTGAWRDCNWTGRGMKCYAGIHVDIKLTMDSVMPDNIFSESIVSAVMSEMKVCQTDGWKRLRSSLVQKFKVNNIPLKPIPDPKYHPELCDVLLDSKDGLSAFHPLDILSHNIGSNRGLLLVLKQIDDQRSDDMDRMEMLVADCNIFMRVMKVIVCFIFVRSW